MCYQYLVATVSISGHRIGKNKEWILLTKSINRIGNTLHYKSQVELSIQMSYSNHYCSIWYMHSHFFEGVNLTGGIPFVLRVNHLGMMGITGSLLVMEGFISLVELSGMLPCTDGVALLVKAGGTRLSTGKVGISGVWRFELKGW